MDYITPLAELAKVFAGLGIATVSLAFLKRTLERRAWRKFKVMVEYWLRISFADDEKHPNELNDIEWKIECERMLLI